MGAGLSPVVRVVAAGATDVRWISCVPIATVFVLQPRISFKP